MIYSGQGKYGLLKDGYIIKINGWTEMEEGDETQDIYFSYRFIDRIKRRRKTAFAFNIDFLAYKDTVKELKKYWKEFKKNK